jgi:8-oxo-dGTP pyrophosphatase MutT (NUDIX family)
MAWKPDVTVAAVVMRNGRFLVVEERIGGRLLFNQPAGHVEDHETLLAAVIRETREETAWRFEPRALVGTYLWRNPVNDHRFLRFTFCGDVDDHRPAQPLDTGIARALWLSRDELLTHSSRLRSPLVMRCIDDYLLGKQQPLDSVACLDLESAVRVPSVVNL